MSMPHGRGWSLTGGRPRSFSWRAGIPERSSKCSHTPISTLVWLLRCRPFSVSLTARPAGRLIHTDASLKSFISASSQIYMNMQGRKAMKNQCHLIMICEYTLSHIRKLFPADIVFPPFARIVGINTSPCAYSAAKHVLCPLDKHLYKNNAEGKIQAAAKKKKITNS